MKTIRTHKVAPTLVQIDPVILEETSRTRRVFLGELGLKADGEWNVRGTIVVERRGAEGWELEEGLKISDLKAGELAKLELSSDQLKRFMRGLRVLESAAQLKGVHLRSSVELVVGKKNEVVQIPDAQRREVINELISHNHGKEFWAALSALQPDIAAQLADAEMQRKRKGSLELFETMLKDGKRWKEPNWERFFVENRWIFGYGLRYQFLGLLQNQANYGGTTYGGKGAQRGEFLMTTGAEQRFTVLVEIKRPDSQFFAPAERTQYRNGVPGFSLEFANAISQVQVNARTWETEGSRREVDRESLSRAGIHTIAPRSILVFGHCNQLTSPDRRSSFELFRSNLRSPDVLTFDELLERARFIVKEADEAAPEEPREPEMQ